jgi:hypothetical protein
VTNTANQASTTFAVDDVMPASEMLPVWRMHEAIKRTLESDVESCSDYHGAVVKGVHYQPLLAAVYTAFNNHYPLVLSPDSMWITIAQGVAHHMAIHGEALRSRFVSHRGKHRLVVEVSDWVDGSPENPWPDAFASWSTQIRDRVGPEIHDQLMCDFTTTGSLERTVSQIVMMDIYERYFAYELYGICGIPAITLEGSPADWQRLADKAVGLARFDLDWWWPHLLPICEQFVRDIRRDVERTVWQRI